MKQIIVVIFFTLSMPLKSALQSKGLVDKSAFLNLHFYEQKMQIEFLAYGSDFGFTVLPDNEADKKKWWDIKKMWEQELYKQVFLTDPSLVCKMHYGVLSLEKDQSKPRLLVSYSGELVCAKSLLGSKMSLAIIEKFPSLKKIKIKLSPANTELISTKPLDQISL